MGKSQSQQEEDEELNASRPINPELRQDHSVQTTPAAGPQPQAYFGHQPWAVSQLHH